MRDPSLEKLIATLLHRPHADQSADEDAHPSEHCRRNITTTAIVALLVIVVGIVYLTSIRAPSPMPEDTYVTIEQGASLSEAAAMLEGARVVQSASALALAVRIRGAERTIRAGDYLFAHPENVFSVARRITTGVFGIEPIRITIPEGANTADMAVIFERRLFKFDATRFLEAAVPLEGYLWPDTYHFMPNTTEDEVISVMRDNFDRRIAPFEDQIAASDFTLHEILTLASIIEKEESDERDRRLISGVLRNRLAIDMRLQVDATFVYTHGKGTYDITLAELRDDSNLYNTYMHTGLPPGPIAAVGESSINAALNPTPNDYLFWLADRRGTTYYSETYEEHLRKKRIYVD